MVLEVRRVFTLGGCAVTRREQKKGSWGDDETCSVLTCSICEVHWAVHWYVHFSVYILEFGKRQRKAWHWLVSFCYVITQLNLSLKSHLGKVLRLVARKKGTGQLAHCRPISTTQTSKETKNYNSRFQNLYRSTSPSDTPYLAARPFVYV